MWYSTAMADTKNLVPVTGYVPAETKQALRMAAARRGWTLSFYISQVLIQEMDQESEAVETDGQ